MAHPTAHRSTHPHALAAAAGMLALTALGHASTATPSTEDQPAATQGRMTIVHGCWGDEHGHLSGGKFLVPDTSNGGALNNATTRGDASDNRVDLVIVGDGYTAGEMAQYNSDAESIANDFFSYEPFIRYRSYFRVSIVEVVSNESGVDNDPSQGIDRDTAMDMRYWCNNTERLLCVNVNKAQQFAQAGAPDVDQILAIANSGKYGGAGYSSSNLGTAAGQNGAAVDIAIHEMGHSLGNLADEYTYGGPATYTGGEPNAENLSLLNASQMASAQTKWHQWLNTSISGFDNPVSTYEGGGYSAGGIYRPSNNSMMRSLGRRFNLPSAERLIREFYREVSPIDAAPANGSAFGPGEAVSILPMRPSGQPLRIEWFANGALVATGPESMTAGELGLPPGFSTVEVRVTDDTPWVRSAAIRSVLTESRSYTLSGCAAYADFNGDRVLDLTDISTFASGFLAGDLAVDIAAPSGVLDLADVIAFVEAFTAGCF